MTDRKLLELAAKAAGIEAVAEFAFVDGTSSGVCSYGLWNRTSGGVFNPLTDDGDALRLAVKLERFADDNFWNRVFSCRNSFDFGVDEHAATRRAIVCAAAAIGKGMK